MGIVTSLITVSCVGLSGQQNDACNKALDAGSKQSGMDQMISTYEEKETKYLERGAENFLGKDAAAATGGTLWLTKSLVEKKATFGLPNLGLCDKLVTEINQGTAKLVFKWTF